MNRGRITNYQESRIFGKARENVLNNPAILDQINGYFILFFRKSGVDTLSEQPKIEFYSTVTYSISLTFKFRF